jgi:hypothetical protein
MHKMMFFKGTPSEKKYSNNFQGIHNFLKIPSVKVLFSNLLSQKGMSYVTLPRERKGLSGVIIVQHQWGAKT